MSGAHRAPVLTLDAAAVRACLRVADCLPLIPPAMIALCDGTAKQLLRSFIPMGEGRTFAQMPAALSERGYFGAKVVSVFADPDNPGHRAHDGVVVLFEGEHGRIVCVADASEITRIRTAAASAAAKTCPRSRERVHARISRIGRTSSMASRCAMACTPPPRIASTAASGRASAPVPAEIDTNLVVRARFFADHRAHVLAHGAEFLRAKAAGLVDDDHILAEIGEVYSGAKPGRRSDDEVTLYKSLGHAVQDLAALSWIYERCRQA